MRSILTLLFVILGGVASAESPMDGKWLLKSLNKDDAKVEFVTETVVSIDDSKFQTVKDGEINGDIGTISCDCKGDPEFGKLYNYDVVLTNGNKHYGVVRFMAICLLRVDGGEMKYLMTTCVNNVPDGERPTEIKSGEGINLCEWEKINEE